MHALLDTSVFSDEAVGMCQPLATTGEAAGPGARRALMAAAGAWACGYGCAL
jgi:hypothetical protein